MNLTEAVNKLGKLMAEFNKTHEPIVTTEQNFVDEKLNDGTTIIRYDAEELATGVVVNLVDASGQVLPLPAGDYTTVDGDTFTVVDDLGTIDNVVLVPDAQEGTPTEVPAAPADTSAPMEVQNVPTKTGNDATASGAPKRIIKSQVTEHVFSIELENEVIEVDLSAMFKKIEDENTALKNLNKEMFSVIEKMSELPVSTPTESKKKFNPSEANKSFRDSLKELELSMSKNNAQ